MRDDDFFWNGVDNGKLLAQRCADCGTLRHPPAPMCANCQSLRWTAQELSGRGEVYCWIVSRHPNRPDDPPRIAALINLDEGIRLVSNIEGQGPVEIGMRVDVVFRDVEGKRLPQFRMAEGHKR